MCIRDRWWSSVAPAIGVDRDFPPWRPTLAQASSDVVRLRAELAELRAQNAELRLTCQLLGERTAPLVERDQRRAAENAALRECDQRRAADGRQRRRTGRCASATSCLSTVNADRGGRRAAPAGVDRQRVSTRTRQLASAAVERGLRQAGATVAAGAHRPPARRSAGAPGGAAGPGRLRTSHEVIIETIGAVPTTMD